MIFGARVRVMNREDENVTSVMCNQLGEVN